MPTQPTRIVEQFARALTDRVVSAVGEEHVTCVFVSGTAADGEELAVADVEGQLEIYSDVDLYVVIGDDIDADDARGRVRAAALAVPLGGAGWRFMRPPDVGVYTFADLVAQPARPGTVGIADRHRVYFGEPGLPAWAAARIPPEIAPEEALYLLENRLRELWALEVSGAPARLRRFYTFKVGLDTGAAWLVYRGRYRTSLEERVSALESDESPEPFPGARLTDPCYRSLENLADVLSSPPAPWEADVVTAAVSTWERIAGALGGPISDETSLLETRMRASGYESNLRQFIAWMARLGWGRLSAITRGMQLARYSPVSALRLGGLCHYGAIVRAERFSAGAAKWEGYVDRLTRACGFANGDLARRSLDLFEAVS